MEVERREQQQVSAKLAYQRWLKNKQAEDKVQMKEKAIQMELRRHKALERQETRRRAQEGFLLWKQQRDLETRLQRQLEKEWMAAISSPSRG